MDSNDYVALNFILLIAGIGLAEYLLWLGFFRHDSPERRMAGYVVVFVGFVIAVTLIDRAVF